MHPLSSLISAHRPRAVCRSAAAGFSLTEVLVAAVLGGVFITSVAGVNSIGNSSLSATTQQQDVEAAVSRDLETIRQTMVSYTWCSGAGTLAPIADSTRCRQSTSNRSNAQYYFPGQATSTTGALSDRDRFLDACSDTTTANTNILLANLVTAISAPALPHPTGATRSVTVIDGAAKRLQISYEGLNPPRSVILTPTVAAWCP